MQTEPATAADGSVVPRIVPTVLMCRPQFFTVSYRINPWMHPDQPTSTDTALLQWQALHRTYEGLGWHVELIDPVPGLNDMVYAANGAFTLDGIAYGASFTYPQRQPEAALYLDHLAGLGFRPHPAAEVNEGEGDLLLVGDTILAGHGFRTSLAAHDEVRTVFDREVLSLKLVDPEFYHLDTALAVLDRDRIAYLPRAFDDESQRLLRARYPDALHVSDADARVLGLNAFGDGRDIVVADRAKDFAQALRAAGFVPHGVELSELLLGGGGVKCCTLELRR